MGGEVTEGVILIRQIQIYCCAVSVTITDISTAMHSLVSV